jgi:predicted transcriptional regulator
MNTVTIEVATVEQVSKRMKAAFHGKVQGEFLSFVSMELLLKTLTPQRWEMIQKMAGKGPMSLRGVARLVGKDVKTTHGNVHALLRNGILKKDEDGKIVFPYDAIHVDFMLTAEAA